MISSPTCNKLSSAATLTHWFIGRSVRSTTIASVLQIPTTPPTTTTPPIIPKKKSRNLNLNSRYGTSRRSALLVVASLV